MLNVLRHLQAPARPLRAWCFALAMGLLLGLGGVMWQAQWAEFNLPALLLEKNKWNTALQQPQSSQSDIDGLQFTLTQTAQRVRVLEQRQSLRLDLQEVQSLLFVKKPRLSQSNVQMQKLRWQEGRFECEGTSLSPEALQELLMQVSFFDRWKIPPQLVHMQHANAVATALPISVLKAAPQSMNFKMEAQLEAQLEGVVMVRQQP
jgi:hypothetical protein